MEEDKVQRVGLALLKNQFILLFSLFLLLFISLTILFGIIYESYIIILANFYLYLEQKIFNFNKISGSQTDYLNYYIYIYIYIWERERETESLLL